MSVQRGTRSYNRVLKKAINRLLTRATQNRDCVFACVYRAATVRESVPKSLFQQPYKGVESHRGPLRCARCFMSGGEGNHD